MGSAPRTLSADDFRHVVGHFASGVTVLTTVHEGRDYGTTASAFTSLSLEPPMVLACVNRGSDTGNAIFASRQMAVNILGEDHSELALKFAQRGGDKFDGVAISRSAEGLPILDGAVATLICSVTEEVKVATHYVFIASVGAAVAAGGPPLTYFRGQFGRIVLG